LKVFLYFRSINSLLTFLSSKIRFCCLLFDKSELDAVSVSKSLLDVSTGVHPILNPVPLVTFVDMNRFGTSSLLVFVLVILAQKLSAGQQQATQESACYEGSQRRQGNFWYVCRGGREVPMSCVAPDGRTQFGVGSTFRTESFVLLCSQPSPNTIQMAPVACVSKVLRN